MINLTNKQTSLFNRFSDDIDRRLFSHPNGIHGVMHTKRVLIFNILLAGLLSLSYDDTRLLCCAAVFHDIGRSHDGVCHVHGRRSWEKICRLSLIETNITSEDTQILRFIIENHCVDDKKSVDSIESYDIIDRERLKFLFGIFKDADGLDRVRIDDLNPRYFRNSVSASLVETAWWLYSQGEFSNSVMVQRSFYE